MDTKPKTKSWQVAQLVERSAVNRMVAGSIPALPAKLTKRRKMFSEDKYHKISESHNIMARIIDENEEKYYHKWRENLPDPLIPSKVFSTYDLHSGGHKVEAHWNDTDKRLRLHVGGSLTYADHPEIKNLKDADDFLHHLKNQTMSQH